MQNIPFHIISGFLGSGKTTLLKKIIEKYSDNTKIGIIQNEFAPANIDGAGLRKDGKSIHLLEIKNGSVFCVCLMGSFVRSLEKFVDEVQPEAIIIESSGLSDTTSVAEVVSSGTLSEKIFLASNWCIVDAVNFSKVGLQKQRVVHQLRMADVVVINKTDLIKNGTDELKTEIRSINPFAEIKEASFCNVDFQLGGAATDKLYFSDQKALPRPDISSMVIKSNKKLSEQALLSFLNEWSPKALRIKGFVNLSNRKSVAVQCTFGSVELKYIENLSQPGELIALTTAFSLHEWSKAFKKLK
ncbi:CobW family GTP-binding protein [Maribellus maritimus]|uniref:CobW family GTP-binding protein n=1 Tax=Maribellus maritimus TaxID=2870838 RepID=UPI001EE9EF19|nr:GTP-binding protein [Maribellus maritimus]MCG6187511.1 GTP-binding protein [Maribellus maritimus]